MINLRLIVTITTLVSAALGYGQGMPPAKDLLLARQVFTALRPNVSKELKVTDSQMKRIEEAFNGGLHVEGDKVMLTISGGSGDSLDEMAAQALKVLDGGQTARLKEIWLQEQGSLAILEPAFAKQLGITKEQTAQADKIAESIAAKIMDLFQDMSGDHEAAAKKVNALRDDARKQFDAILTADQKKSLETMKGKPFKQDKPG